jgi:endo-1,4-beta-mannosidase
MTVNYLIREIVKHNVHYGDSAGLRNSVWKNTDKLILSTLEGMQVVKGLVWKKDLGFVSAFTTNDTEADYIRNRENTKKLGEDIHGNGFGIQRFLGHYKGRDKDGKVWEGDEWSYGVINDSMSPEGFFQYIIDLGNKYGQKSVMLVPAQDTFLKRDSLDGGRAYYFYLDASDKAEQLQDMGTLQDTTVEQWIAENTDSTGSFDEGWTRSTGTKDTIIFGHGEKEAHPWSFKVHGIDFSRACATGMGLSSIASVKLTRKALEEKAANWRFYEMAKAAAGSM